MLPNIFLIFYTTFPADKENIIMIILGHNVSFYGLNELMMYTKNCFKKMAKAD